MTIQRTDTRNVSEDELAQLIEKNRAIYTEHYDPTYLKSIFENVCDFIDQHYFRSKFIGFEDIPQRNNPDRPLIYVSNHSGMSFPWDGIIFCSGLFKLHKYNANSFIRGIASPMLSMLPLMSPYLIKDLWKRCGVVDATSLNFETMMNCRDSNILIYPEGVPGMAKGFNKRYQLQRFSTSFIRMSIKYKTDIIPFYTINAEYINPFSYNSDWANSVVQSIGVPFLPLGLTLILILLQPYSFYMAFPAHLTYVMGKRIKPYEMVDKPFNQLNRKDLVELTERVQRQMQQSLDEAVEKYGKKPYQIMRLWKTALRNASKTPYFFPCGWPLLFTEHERLYKKKNKGAAVNMKIDFFSFVEMLIKNPSVIAFYLPIIGWIPIMWRALRTAKFAAHNFDIQN